MKIFCIGRNYAEHAAELGNKVPGKPMIFMKPSTSLLINNNPLYYPAFTSDLHYEVEVVLKICKNGRHVQKEFADSYYEEIGLGIDFTARDVQSECKEKGHPWEIAKAFDHSALLSKELIHKSKLDLDELLFSLKKNDELVQSGNTKDLIFNFNTLVCYISTIFTLKNGDYIYTGTPAGVGSLQIGDNLEGFINNRSMFICKIK